MHRHRIGARPRRPDARIPRLALGRRHAAALAGLLFLVAAVPPSAAHRPPDPVELGTGVPVLYNTEYDPVASASDLEMVAGGARRASSGDWAARFGLDEGPYVGGPESAARAYLNEQGADFGLQRGDADLQTLVVQETPGGITVRFLQTLGGVPVWRSDLTVVLDRDGRFVRSVHSNYDPITARQGAAPASLVSTGVALQAAAAAVGIAQPAPDADAMRAWLSAEPQVADWILRDGDRIGGEIHRVWRVMLPVRTPLGEWFVAVDAGTGAVLHVEDARVHVDGSGMVFEPDPLTTAGVAYGGNYGDNNDGDTNELNAERVTRSLPDLTFEGGVYKLIGPHVRIVEFESPNSPPVTNADPHGFVYTRSQQGFEDVNVYHHIDRSQRHIQSLGYDNIQNLSIQIDTHGLNGADNSYYLIGSNRIAFGEGGVDDAEDVDVVVHEYGHAIQHAQVPGWGGGQQGAMGEGFGDYWAGSFSSSMSLYRSEWVFNWDGHNPFWGGRVLNTTLTYPGGLNGSIHHDGQIWSAALMQCYYELGRDIMDQLVLEGHYVGGTGTNMPLSAAAVMQSDLNLYDGLHAGTLDHFFTARGFFTAAQYDVPALTHTPLTDTGDPGPYPISVQIQSTSPVQDATVKVRFGTGTEFDQEATLSPAGGGLYTGAIPSQGGGVDIRYYIVAKNTANWTGTAPRGAETQFHQFHVEGTSSVGDGAVAARLELAPPTPNPAFGSAVLAFALDREATADLSIFDTTGRKVRTLLHRTVPAGVQRVQWDGKDDRGRSVPEGIYFYRLEADGDSRTQRLILLD